MLLKSVTRLINCNNNNEKHFQTFEVTLSSIFALLDTYKLLLNNNKCVEYHCISTSLHGITLYVLFGHKGPALQA